MDDKVLLAESTGMLQAVNPFTIEHDPWRNNAMFRLEVQYFKFQTPIFIDELQIYISLQITSLCLKSIRMQIEMSWLHFCCFYHGWFADIWLWIILAFMFSLYSFISWQYLCIPLEDNIEELRCFCVLCIIYIWTSLYCTLIFY